MKVRLSPILLTALFVACSLFAASRAAVFSIDFGSEWIKVALVKVSLCSRSERSGRLITIPCFIYLYLNAQPGVPMEIVLNK